MQVIEQKICDCIKPIVENLGYELVAVKQGNPHGIYTVSVIIYKKGPMSLEDCELVHNAINEPLDILNPTEDKPYNLEVSSMGLDWPIKTDDDFRRRLDEDIEITLYAKLDGEKKYVGKLVSYDADKFEILADVGKKGALKQKNIVFERKAVAKAVPYVKF